MKHLFLLIMFIGVVSCHHSSEYYQMEERELASGIRHDSLFFGLYLGMPAKDFYDRCWKLNKQGLVREGTSNTTVYYRVTDFNNPAAMDFYPIFYKDSIVSMPITFTYEAWSPWNKDLFAIKLMPEVLTLMEEWFGPGFIEVASSDPQKGTAYVKMDGNRRISVYSFSDQYVNVDIVDLPTFRKMTEKERAQ